MLGKIAALDYLVQIVWFKSSSNHSLDYLVWII